jgi:hypothetical protein
MQYFQVMMIARKPLIKVYNTMPPTKTIAKISPKVSMIPDLELMNVVIKQRYDDFA